MRRTVPRGLVWILLTATAGCQTISSPPIEAPRDDLTVTRTFHAPFDAVNQAMQSILKDHEAMRDIASLDDANVVQTWRTWKTPFRKEASRDIESGDRSVRVKVEQRTEGCVVTARVSTGTEGDPSRSAALLDRIGQSIDTAEPGR